MNKPKEFDTIEFLKDLPEHKIEAGQQGVIIEVWNEHDFHIEVFDANNETILIETFPSEVFKVVFSHKNNHIQ